MAKINRLLTCCAAVMLLSGCSSLAYYRQLVVGQAQLLAARQPIEHVLTQPATDPVLAARLRLVLQARRYASTDLALPDNGSYRYYADLKRPYVVWNLFATGPYSLKPVQSCFPIAGCVAYRGFYSQSQALKAADQMKARGLDTYVSGVLAYSTLGWFNDPVLNTMMVLSDDSLASTIFHELAHQRFYLKGDSAFNESFATFVEQQGLTQWRRSRGMAPQDTANAYRREQFTRLILDSRKRLEALYSSGKSEAQMAIGKAIEFETLRQNYRKLRDQQWHGQGLYDDWFNNELNNARLLPFGLYNHWVPAFRCLFWKQKGKWPDFYHEVERIGALPEKTRRQIFYDVMHNCTGTSDVASGH